MTIIFDKYSMANANYSSDMQTIAALRGELEQLRKELAAANTHNKELQDAVKAAYFEAWYTLAARQEITMNGDDETDFASSEAAKNLTNRETKMNQEIKPDAPAKDFTEILRDHVFDSISDERRYQDQKWGDAERHPQSVGAFLTLMRVHLARAESAWAVASNNIEALDHLRKVLALGVACGEQHGMPKREYSSVKCGDS